MKRLQLFIAVTAVSCSALVPHAWGVTLDEWPIQCKLYFRQAQFTETTAHYDFFGACGFTKDTSLSWTFNAKAAYTDGKPVGKAHEHFIFNSQEAPGELRLSMDCFGDPWIDGGLCSHDSLRITWSQSSGAFYVLGKHFSPDGPIPPPFSASYLRQDPQLIQAYKSQRQAYLANLQQERTKRQQARITAQAKPVPGLSEKLNAPYMPTILSPGESAQFTKGGPVVLMVKAPERDTLGNVVQIEFQSCIYDQARNACNWTPRGIEGGVNVPDLLAGTYRLPARIVDATGSWRLRVQRPADPGTATPAGYPSQWRRFGIIPLAAQPGPILKGPVFGR